MEIANEQKMEKRKRERGANYTAEEKTLLAELVTKFKHIIEDKRTGGIFILKKKEAWKKVTIEYNSNCTTARETKQLKVLYDNLKQNSRKKSMTQDDSEKASKNLIEDKVQMNKTGGGFWKTKSTDCDSKILDTIQDQVEPLPNPYDSAAAYFKEMDSIYGEDHCTAVASTLSAPKQETNDTYLSELGQHDINNIELSPSQTIVVQIDEDQGIQKNITKKVMVPSRGRVVKKKQVPKKIKKDNSSEALKKIYFKKKIQNTQMERKKLALEILYMKEKHKLEMEILKRTKNK